MHEQQRVRSLLAQLESGNSRVRRSADDALSEIFLRGPEAAANIRLLNEGVKFVVRTFEEGRRLREQHYSRIRGTPLVGLLLEALASGGENAKVYSASVLSLIEDRRAIAPLMHAVRHDVPAVRAAVAGALWHFADPSTVDVLLEALEDDDEWTRSQAASSLSFMKEERAVAPLLRLLTSDNPSDRSSALRALGSIGDTSTLPTLREHLRDKSQQVRKAAKSALADFDLRRRRASRDS
jgi:HEAT repeat protein